MPSIVQCPAEVLLNANCYFNLQESIITFLIAPRKHKYFWEGQQCPFGILSMFKMDNTIHAPKYICYWGVLSMQCNGCWIFDRALFILFKKLFREQIIITENKFLPILAAMVEIHH